MKKRDTLFTFLLVGVFLLSFASAGWFSDTWSFITGKAVSTPTCIDSDGGLNYYVKGNASITSSDGSVSSSRDSCSFFARTNKLIFMKLSV